MTHGVVSIEREARKIVVSSLRRVVVLKKQAAKLR